MSLFDDLGVWRLLTASADPSNLKDFVREWLAPLIEYDAKHQSDLSPRCPPISRVTAPTEATARSLFIHRSTLRYRLARIEQLSGRRLDDPHHRFNFPARPSCESERRPHPAGVIPLLDDHRGGKRRPAPDSVERDYIMKGRHRVPASKGWYRRHAPAAEPTLARSLSYPH